MVDLGNPKNRMISVNEHPAYSFEYRGSSHVLRTWSQQCHRYEARMN